MCANNSRSTYIRHIEKLLFVIGKKDCLILACLKFTLTHNKGLNTPDTCIAMGIGVNRDKQIALSLIGDIGTSLKVGAQIGGEVTLGFAGIDNLNIGHIFLNHSTELERHLQIDIFLGKATITSARINTTVTCIDNDNFYPLSNILSLHAVNTHCKAEKGEYY